MTMDELKPGQSAYISSVGGSGALRHHLLDMGLTPQTEITLQKVAPMGDPVQFQLRGYELTLRLEEARKVTVDQVHTKPVRASVVGARRNSSTPHPGVGELVKAGGYHTVHDGAAIPKGSPLTFALAGNQNCGKTTLFNQLTGSNQHVGNFPGVTVDRKDGTIRSHPEATVTDLPGIYSLSPYSNEEIVTRDFLLNTHPSGIINIVDASNIERNLYLTMQLMELGIPMVLALNMMDEVRAALSSSTSLSRYSVYRSFRSPRRKTRVSTSLSTTRYTSRAIGKYRCAWISAPKAGILLTRWEQCTAVSTRLLCCSRRTYRRRGFP